LLCSWAGHLQKGFFKKKRIESIFKDGMDELFLISNGRVFQSVGAATETNMSQK